MTTREVGMSRHREPVVITCSADVFAADEREDRRNLELAVVLAIVFHIVLLAVQLPKMMRADEPDEQVRKVYVVQQTRFRPPPPEQQRQIPKPRATRVPIPDPTPDAPEPLRVVEEIERYDEDLGITDVIFDIPAGPPVVEADSAGPIHVGGSVLAPVKIYDPKPLYSEVARKARIQGVVILQAVIDRQGNVTDVKVLKGLPFGLTEGAVEAVRQWKFEPATLNGKPVAVYYNLTVNFSLQ
jgi:protein TonB